VLPYHSLSRGVYRQANPCSGCRQGSDVSPSANLSPAAADLARSDCPRGLYDRGEPCSAMTTSSSRPVTSGSCRTSAICSACGCCTRWAGPASAAAPKSPTRSGTDAAKDSRHAGAAGQGRHRLERLGGGVLPPAGRHRAPQSSPARRPGDQCRQPGGDSSLSASTREAMGQDGTSPFRQAFQSRWKSAAV
jgi:hypothetical protein